MLFGIGYGKNPLKCLDFMRSRIFRKQWQICLKFRKIKFWAKYFIIDFEFSEKLTVSYQLYGNF